MIFLPLHMALHFSAWNTYYLMSPQFETVGPEPQIKKKNYFKIYNFGNETIYTSSCFCLHYSHFEFEGTETLKWQDLQQNTDPLILKITLSEQHIQNTHRVDWTKYACWRRKELLCTLKHLLKLFKYSIQKKFPI